MHWLNNFAQFIKIDAVGVCLSMSQLVWVCVCVQRRLYGTNSFSDWKMNKLTDKLQFILLNLTHKKLTASHTKIEWKFEEWANICTNLTWTIDMNRTWKLLSTNRVVQTQFQQANEREKNHTHEKIMRIE